MNHLLKFFKKTIMGGLFVVLPVLLLILLLSKVMHLLVSVATPIANLFQKGALQEARLPVLLAVLLLVGTSFMVGLWLYSSMARRLGDWIERNTLGQLPMYRFVKNLVSGLLGDEASAGIKPALLRSGEGKRDIVYIMEDHHDGQLTILVPLAPSVFSGTVKIVDEDQVERLATSLSEVSGVLNHLGLGTREILQKNRQTESKA